MGQHPEGLAQGVAGDAQGAAERLLGQSGAGAQRARGDPVSQQVGDPPHRAGPAEQQAVGGELPEQIRG
jgi:hypothetical protein